MKTVCVCFAVLALVGVLVSSPAHALLIGDGYEDSIVFRFWEVVEANPNIRPLDTLIGGYIRYDVVGDANPEGTITLEVFDEPHIANLDPIAVYPLPSLSGRGIGVGTFDSTIPQDGDGALRITVTGGVLHLNEAQYFENRDGLYYAASWFSGEIPPVPHPVPSPVPEPSTLLLLASGLAGLGGVAWRHRKN